MALKHHPVSKITHANNTTPGHASHGSHASHACPGHVTLVHAGHASHEYPVIYISLAVRSVLCTSLRNVPLYVL